jgi:hypothetical protein
MTHKQTAEGDMFCATKMHYSAIQCNAKNVLQNDALYGDELCAMRCVACSCKPDSSTVTTSFPPSSPGTFIR